MALATLLLLSQAQVSCNDCTDPNICLYTEVNGDSKCLTLDKADEFGGCGESGIYAKGDTQVAFSSKLCTTSTSTATTPDVEGSPSSSRSLKGGEIAGIVVGSIALVGAAIGITLLIGKRREYTQAKYASLGTRQYM